MKRIALLLAATAFQASVAFASVDVNTATKQELEAEGIGSTAAQAIIEYRTKNGPFKSSDEVHKVISDAIAAKMSVGISISGPATAKAAAPTAPPPVAAAPKDKPAEAKATPAPEAKAPAAAASDKAAEKASPKDDQKLDNVRERAKKDADDRKT